MPARNVAGVGRTTTQKQPKRTPEDGFLTDDRRKIREADTRLSASRGRAQKQHSANGAQWICLAHRIEEAAKTGDGLGDLTPNEVQMLNNIKVSHAGDRNVNQFAGLLRRLHRDGIRRGVGKHSWFAAAVDIILGVLDAAPGVGINRHGEIEVSLRTLANRWAWSKTQVDRFLDELHELEFIERRTGTAHGTPRTFITIYASRDSDGKIVTRGTVKGTSGDRPFNPRCSE